MEREEARIQEGECGIRKKMEVIVARTQEIERGVRKKMEEKANRGKDTNIKRRIRNTK